MERWLVVYDSIFNQHEILSTILSCRYISHFLSFFYRKWCVNQFQFGFDLFFLFLSCRAQYMIKWIFFFIENINRIEKQDIGFNWYIEYCKCFWEIWFIVAEIDSIILFCLTCLFILWHWIWLFYASWQLLETLYIDYAIQYKKKTL